MKKLIQNTTLSVLMLGILAGFAGSADAADDQKSFKASMCTPVWNTYMMEATGTVKPPQWLRSPSDELIFGGRDAQGKVMCPIIKDSVANSIEGLSFIKVGLYQAVANFPITCGAVASNVDESTTITYGTSITANTVGVKQLNITNVIQTFDAGNVNVVCTMYKENDMLLSYSYAEKLAGSSY